jgi:Nicastrin/Nicastrin small lobe
MTALAPLLLVLFLWGSGPRLVQGAARAADEPGAGLWTALPQRLPLYTAAQAFPCTTLTRGGGWAGCRSMSLNGESGRLWPLLTMKDADEFLGGSSSSTPTPASERARVPDGELIPVLSAETFTRDVTERLLGMGPPGALPDADHCPRCKDVVGLVVLDANSVGSRPAASSVAARYPQREFSLYPGSTRQWNPAGSEDGWVMANYTKPVWLMMTATQAATNPMRNVNNDPLVDWQSAFTPEQPFSSDDILELAKANRERQGLPPQWGMKLKSFMQAAGTTEVCRRRSQCKALGSWNIWAVPGAQVPRSRITSSDKILYLLAGMDSNAFFHENAPGARSAMSGAVAAAAATIAIHATGDADKLTAVPVLGLFGAESWGYLGSRAFVQDVTNPTCDTVADDDINCDSPWIRNWNDLRALSLDPARVAGVIELNQVGKVSQETFYAHFDPRTPSPTPLMNALNASALRRGGIVLPASTVANNRELPPSSLMSFLRTESGGVRQIPSVVFAEHDTSYTNLHYHSRFDDSSNVDLATVCNASQIVADTIWELAGGNLIPNATAPQVDCSVVRGLFTSLVDSYDTRLARSVLFPPDDIESTDARESLPATPTQYASVWSKKSLNSVSVAIIHNYLFKQLNVRPSSGSCTQGTDCDAPEQCIMGKCITANVFFHDAESRFATDGDETAGQWTESDWSQLYVDVFQMDSPGSEIGLLIGGILVCLASIATTWFGRRWLSNQLKLN